MNLKTATGAELQAEHDRLIGLARAESHAIPATALHTATAKKYLTDAAAVDAEMKRRASAGGSISSAIIATIKGTAGTITQAAGFGLSGLAAVGIVAALLYIAKK